MGVIIGVVVGYAMGAQAGEQGWKETVEAWREIRRSEELRDLAAAGWSIARDLLAGGGERLATRLRQEPPPALRGVA